MLKLSLRSIILSLMVSSLLIYSSCKNDDEDPSPATIIGTWETVDTDTEFAVSINGIPLTQQLIELLLEGSGVDFSTIDDDDAVLEFREDGTYRTTDGDNVSDEGTYSLSADGKVLTLDNSIEMDIVRLTSSQMILQGDINDSFEEDGDLIEIKVDFDVDLQRVE
ncbi:MAG: hypothetical protein ACNS62_05035 [Candidatus Cyclobacteriaceae bacterium M3_2C_046]